MTIFKPFDLNNDGQRFAYLPTYVTYEKSHHFNSPFCFRLDESDLKLKENCVKVEKQVFAGDILVLETDGLHDNMFADLLAYLLNMFVLF